MDVSVLHRHGQPWQRVLSRPSILGGGLLERARSTTLALLGVTAAVGLVMVALALNQSWPLIAGSSIPRIPPRHQGVGKATAVAGLEPGLSHSRAARAPRGSSSPKVASGGGRRAGGRASVGAVAPAGETEFVVSPHVPTTPQDGVHHPAAGGPAPTGQQVEEVAPTLASQPPSPATPSPPTTSVVTQSAPPLPSTAEAPANEPEQEPETESPWDHGNDHSYGNGGEGGSGWVGGGSHGRGYSGSHGHRFGS